MSAIREAFMRGSMGGKRAAEPEVGNGHPSKRHQPTVTELDVNGTKIPMVVSRVMSGDANSHITPEASEGPPVVSVIDSTTLGRVLPLDNMLTMLAPGLDSTLFVGSIDPSRMLYQAPQFTPEPPRMRNASQSMTMLATRYSLPALNMVMRGFDRALPLPLLSDILSRTHATALGISQGSSLSAHGSHPNSISSQCATSTVALSKLIDHVRTGLNGPSTKALPLVGGDRLRLITGETTLYLVAKVVETDPDQAFYPDAVNNLPMMSARGPVHHITWQFSIQALQRPPVRFDFVAMDGGVAIGTAAPVGKRVRGGGYCRLADLLRHTGGSTLKRDATVDARVDSGSPESLLCADIGFWTILGDE